LSKHDKELDEEELGDILLEIINRRMALTPSPTVILFKEYEKIYLDYNIAVAKAQNSYHGFRER
jgi:hypothetical protein